MSKIMYGGIAYGSAVNEDYGWTDLTGTLQAGETTLTIQHEIITPDVTIVPHSDPYGVNPKDMVVTNGQVVLTFNAQPNDVGIMVRVSKTNPVLKFTKTSVVDKTQFPNIAFNSDYTNYELLLFVYSDTDDSNQIEFLIPSSMITEIFTYTQMMFNRQGGNHYARYSKTSNTTFSQVANNRFSLIDVYSVTCNKTIVVDDIYKLGGTSALNAPISYDGILNNDLIFITSTGNGFIVVNNSYLNLLGGVKDVNTTFMAAPSQYNANLNAVLVGSDYMTTFYYFCVIGIKFI